MRRLSACGIGLLAVSVGAYLLVRLMEPPLVSAQSADAQLPSFEIASIKPDNGSGMGIFRIEPGTYSVERMSAEFLLMTAYNIKSFQIVGEPKWVQSERFDIEAKTDNAIAEKMKAMTADETSAQLRPLLQSLLAERFKLVAHRTTKEMRAFSFVGSKAGRLPASQKACGPIGPPQPEQAGKWPEPPCGGFFQTWGHVAGDDVPINRLVSALAVFTGETVQDNTGLTGKYDITLDWTPDLGQAGPPQPGSTFPQPEANGPSLQAALEDQLGLKLVTTKTAVDALVIDHIEEPSPN
jgi:uncharacterized protein (TIGR03435 family)